MKHRFRFVTILFIAAYLVIFSLACNRQSSAFSDEIISKMVNEMVAARQSQTQISYLTETYGPFSMEQAYQIQARLTKELTQYLGKVTGYKVGYASKAAQKQFGVNEPASGPLFLLRRLSNGSTLPVAELMEIAIETEVAFTIGRRIEQEMKNVDELKPYVKWVHAAFDIGDYRYKKSDKKPTVQDMVASGVIAHYYVLGPAVDPKKVDIDSLQLREYLNGELISDSPATEVMGSPWNSLLWLANHVHKLGGRLEPGEVILTGTAAPAYKASGDKMKGEYVGDCGKLGRVQITVK